MNILYCGDSKTEDGLLISILSLMEHVEEGLHIYIMTMTCAPREPISDHTVRFLDQKVREAHRGNFVRKIDATELFERQKPTANMETRFTPYCMLRLYADLVKEIPDRILYLDNDVICRKNFSICYHQNIEDYELAGVPDHYGKWFFSGNPIRHDYMNSGVLFLNMRKIRETGLFARCRQMCAQKKKFMPDQSAINLRALKKKLLPRRFNEQRKLHAGTVFQHFTTSFRFIPWPRTVTVKPWQVDLVHEKLKLHEYDELLATYEKLLPQMRAEEPVET